MSANGRQPTERELLSAALVRAQAKMPAVEKTAKANYGMYATIDHLIAKTRKVLNDEGLAIIQFPAVSDLGAPVLRTVIVHEAGGREQADAPLFMAKQDMQTLGAAITYARRYAWSSVCGIASEHDDDGAETTKPAEEMPAPGTVQHPEGQRVADPYPELDPVVDEGKFPPDIDMPPPAIIEEKARRRLRAEQKRVGMSDDRLKELVREIAGVESSKDIPAVRYDALLAALKAEEPRSGYVRKGFQVPESLR